jgi:hypothetical protein
MRRFFVACVLFALPATTAWSGVVVEMEVSSGTSGEKSTDTIYSAGKKLRVDPHKTRESGETSMVFRDGEMLIIDHADKSCRTLDKEGLAELTSQLGGAMKQIQDTLDKLPPEQREMMAKMMQGRLPAGMAEEAPPRRIEKGGTEQVGGRTCTVHTLYSGDQKAWEVCAAKDGEIEGYDELMESFQALSDFTEQLRALASQIPFGAMIDTPFSDIQEIGGVPIRVRTYVRGKLESESTLRSISRRDIDAAMFEAPQGYQVKRLTDDMRRAR